MKNTIRLLALLMSIALLVSVAVLALQADAEELVNLYDVTTAYKGAVPNTTDPNGATTSLSGYFGSKPIAVTGGSKLYFGPCDPTHSWHLALYPSTTTPNVSARAAGRGQFIVVDTFADGSVIYSFQIPSDVGAVALASKERFFNHTLITLNQEFDKLSYFAYADAQNWTLENALRPTEGATATTPNGFVNYFPRTDAYDASLHKNVNESTYKTSGLMAVAQGDVICFGAANMTQTKEHLTAYNSSMGQVAALTSSKLTLKEDIGRGFGIYTYTVPADVAYVTATVHIGVYNDGDMLLTKNQPFTGDQLREALGITYLAEGAEDHAFYGKDALFIGDSITYGSFDTPQSYRNPSASWARRLALSTGLNVTNAGVGGSSISYQSNRGWIYSQYTENKDKDFDMIVMHGGVNDARDSVVYGTPSRGEITSEKLSDSSKLSTYTGGLEWLFYNVRRNWPDAELYYIANFQLTAHYTGNARNMKPYFAQAAKLCETYGVTMIDLYNNEELYETFNPADSTIMPDQLHPTKAGYDLLFPTILKLFNESLVVETPQETTGATTTAATPTTATPTTATPTTVAPTTAAPTTVTPTVAAPATTETPTVATTLPETTPAGTTEAPATTEASTTGATSADEGEGCRSSAMGGLAILLTGAAGYAAMNRKKKEND